MTDSDNAHVRKRQGRRQQPDVGAAEARRLLDDPAFDAAVGRVKGGLVDALEAIKHDGSPEMDAYERELCRALRTLNSVTRSLSLVIQGQAFKTSDITLLRKTGSD